MNLQTYKSPHNQRPMSEIIQETPDIYYYTTTNYPVNLTKLQLIQGLSSVNKPWFCENSENVKELFLINLRV